MSKFMIISGAVATTMAASDSFVPIYDVAAAPADASVVSRRLNLGSDFQAAITGTLEDSDFNNDARNMVTETAFSFQDFSPSELLADRAREALLNRDEAPPRNVRERVARRARDAAIERAISTLEFAGKEKEDEVREFLEDNLQEARDFASTEVAEWEVFFEENAAEVVEFIGEHDAVDQLLRDPFLATDKQFWTDNAEALREFLGENAEANDFALEQVEDALEFLEQNAVQASAFFADNLEFLTENVEKIVALAKMFGIQHDTLDALEEFTNDPEEFFAEYAMEFLDQKVVDPLIEFGEVDDFEERTGVSDIFADSE